MSIDTTQKGQGSYKRILDSVRLAREIVVEHKHVDGARDARKTTMLAIYRAGGCSVAQGLAYGAKPADHLAAYDTGKVTLDQLIAAGVDLHRLETVRKQREARAATAQAKVTYRAERPLALINGQAVKVKAAPLTAHEIAVREAVAASKAREARNAELAKVKAELAKRNLVNALSPSELAALVARNASKGAIVLK